MHRFLTKLVVACLVLLGDSAIASTGNHLAAATGDAFSVAQSQSELPDQANEPDSSDGYVANSVKLSPATPFITAVQVHSSAPAPHQHYQPGNPRAPPVHL